MNNKGKYHHQMTKCELLKKIAHLEFVNDQLMAEVTYTDTLLKQIGFAEGLATMKCTAEEILEFGWQIANEG